MCHAFSLSTMGKYISVQKLYINGSTEWILHYVQPIYIMYSLWYAKLAGVPQFSEAESFYIFAKEWMSSLPVFLHLSFMYKVCLSFILHLSFKCYIFRVYTKSWNQLAHPGQCSLEVAVPECYIPDSETPFNLMVPKSVQLFAVASTLKTD